MRRAHLGRDTARPPSERLAFALDVPDLEAARRLLAVLAPHVGVFKVGLELFTSEGPAAARAVTDAGAACFLDLKLHDIPATVAGAVRAAGVLGARYLTVHAAGGPDMLRAAATAAQGSTMQLLAVTVLTSMNQGALDAVGLAGGTQASVLRLAKLAADAGIDGLVCSPEECRAIRSEFGDGPLLVVPGVRPEGGDQDDQRRTSSPAEAVAAGADILVVGRPIRNAADPAAAARAILDDMAKA